MDQQAETEENGDVTAAEDSQQPFPPPSTGTPLKPPLSEAKQEEEEDLEEDFDASDPVVSIDCQFWRERYCQMLWMG